MILLLVLEFEFLPGLNYFEISCLFKLFQNRSLRKTSRTLACAEPSFGEHTLPLCLALDLPVVGFFSLFLWGRGGGIFFPFFSFLSYTSLFPLIQVVDGIEALVAVDVRAVWQP